MRVAWKDMQDCPNAARSRRKVVWGVDKKVLGLEKFENALKVFYF